ncbi:Uncharacterised protein [Mycobacterium tuberculosis]|nr:Uncharacterised protein [Mycobacterium tuberculosis]CFR72902.1 Uncharacterised protein [Mycobacterium tuberculosis]CKR90859.1 Uncharacterised protein [Mycobacterium tuberculosis]CKT29785.1 Uncharacterised protein [Mycobacterium tuberculosis]CKT64753.1 Uncharacterised protein [Mycobacterium tuberculosis]
MGEGHIQQRLITLGRDVQPTGRGRTLPVGDRGDAIANQQVVDEGAMPFGYELPGLLGIDTALLGADVFGRQQHVDSVRLATRVLLDPGQLALQPFGAMCDGTEDPEPARIGHRRHHIPAVAERAYWKLSTEQLGDSGPHCDDAKSY